MTRLHLKETPNRVHKELAGAVCWSAAKELYTGSDDKSIHKWSMKGDSQATVAQGLGFFITDLDFSALGSKASASMAIASSDGCLRLMSTAGKVEKVAERAHNGSVICVRWSRDGCSLATAGEDGAVKTWSATGMVRATVAQRDKPVYCLAWSPDSTQVCFGSGAHLHVEPVESASKSLSWLALDDDAAQLGAVVLSIDWCKVNGHIVSGGEDCRYRVWDAFGRQLYRSEAMTHPVTAVSWRPSGHEFAAGYFNAIALCDQTGWIASKQRFHNGSPLDMAWLPDGTKIAAVCGDGAVLVGSVLDATHEAGRLQVRLKEERTLEMTDIFAGTVDEVEFAEPVVATALGHGRLLVATTSQCKVFNVAGASANMSSPAVFDLKEPVMAILMAPRCFVLLDALNGAQVYTYEGRLLCAPKFKGMRPDILSHHMVAVSDDTVAVLDPTTRTTVHFFNAATGAELSEALRIRKDGDARKMLCDGGPAVMDIVRVGLSQTGGTGDRQLVFLDRNRDLYISGVVRPAVVKLAASVDSFAWSESCDVLAAISDNRLTVWYYPEALLVNKELVELTRERKEVDFGVAPQIECFSGGLVTIRQSDGIRKASAISPYAMKLYELVSTGRWDAALKLCRFLKDRMLWACLAATSIKHNQLDKAEAAFAAIGHLDKVLFLKKLQDLPNRDLRRAELLLFQRKDLAAEEVLLGAGLVWRSIKLNIKLFNWERALQIATKHAPHHVPSVVWYRAQHLAALGRNPDARGKGGEEIDAFAHLVKEHGIAREDIVKAAIRADKDAEPRS